MKFQDSNPRAFGPRGSKLRWARYCSIYPGVQTRCSAIAPRLVAVTGREMGCKSCFAPTGTMSRTCHITSAWILFSRIASCRDRGANPQRRRPMTVLRVS